MQEGAMGFGNAAPAEWIDNGGLEANPQYRDVPIEYQYQECMSA
jgi:hypothetical protein